MFDRILLALDDSPAGEVAALFTTALARRAGAAVHVLHVNERIIAGRGLTVATRHEVTELVGRTVQQMADAGVRAAGSVCVAPSCGVPDRIVEVAHSCRADAIVLGSHRHRRLSRLLSTQVRERTMRATSLPVLVAPAPLKVTTLGPAEPWESQLDQMLDTLLH